MDPEQTHLPENENTEVSRRQVSQTGSDRKKHFLSNKRGTHEQEMRERRDYVSRTRDSKRVRVEGEEGEGEEGGERGARKPKRSVALLMGYCGSGYQGMQVNIGAKTIEGELFSALIKAGAVSQDNANDQKKVQLQRAARTDKGVHAAGQVVSLKMIVEDESIIDKVNSILPEQIRIWGMIRTIKSFNPKTLCDSRIYEYLLPTYVFMDPEEEIVELTKSKTMEERQQMLMTKNDEIIMLVNNNSMQMPVNAGIKEQEKKNGTGTGANSSDNESTSGNENENENENGSGSGGNKIKADRARQKRTSYRISAEKLALIREMFAKYVGTHDFYNFTVSRGTTGNNSTRVIKSFTVSEPMLIKEKQEGEEGEWLSLKVHGQSFMLHQIRKMVGLIILLARKTHSMNENSIESSTDSYKLSVMDGIYKLRAKENIENIEKNTVETPTEQPNNGKDNRRWKGGNKMISFGERVNIPKAPGFALLLERPVFESYNNRINSLKTQEESKLRNQRLKKEKKEKERIEKQKEKEAEGADGAEGAEVEEKVEEKVEVKEENNVENVQEKTEPTPSTNTSGSSASGSGSGEREELTFDPYTKEIEAFKKRFIYDEIVKQEIERGLFYDWVNYCDLFPEQYSEYI